MVDWVWVWACILAFVELHEIILNRFVEFPLSRDPELGSTIIPSRKFSIQPLAFGLVRKILLLQILHESTPPMLTFSDPLTVKTFSKLSFTGGLFQAATFPPDKVPV